MRTGSSDRIAEAARTFGAELRWRRSQAGLTQRELAEKVRYSRETVAAVERGRRYATEDLALRCDEALGTGGALGRLWPHVESARVAADRRRGPRASRPEPVRWSPVDVDAWVATIRPTIDHAPPEFMVRLRDLVNDLVPATG